MKRKRNLTSPHPRDSTYICIHPQCIPSNKSSGIYCLPKKQMLTPLLSSVGRSSVRALSYPASDGMVAEFLVRFWHSLGRFNEARHVVLRFLDIDVGWTRSIFLITAFGGIVCLHVLCFLP